MGDHMPLWLLASPMLPHRTCTTHMLERRQAQLSMPQPMFQSMHLSTTQLQPLSTMLLLLCAGQLLPTQPHTDQPQLWCTSQLLWLTQPQLPTTQLQLSTSSQFMTSLLFTSTAMLLPTITLVLTLPQMRRGMAMLPTASTVLPYLTAAPRL